MEIGPFSTELGIHEGNFITKLEALDKSKVTKGLILEIYHYVISSQCKTATFGDFYRAIKHSMTLIISLSLLLDQTLPQ